MKTILVFGALMIASMLLTTILSSFNCSDWTIFLTSLGVGGLLGFLSGKAGYYT